MPPHGPFRGTDDDLQPDGNHAYIHEEEQDTMDTVYRMQNMLTSYRAEHAYLLSVVDRLPPAVAITARYRLHHIALAIRHYERELRHYLQFFNGEPRLEYTA